MLTLAFVYRQVTTEGKALPIEARPHERHEDRARAHEGNDRYPPTLGQCYYVCARISHSRTACLGDHSHRFARERWGEVGAEDTWVSMLIELVEGQGIDVH